MLSWLPRMHLLNKSQTRTSMAIQAYELVVKIIHRHRFIQDTCHMSEIGIDCIGTNDNGTPEE